MNSASLLAFVNRMRQKKQRVASDPRSQGTLHDPLFGGLGQFNERYMSTLVHYFSQEEEKRQQEHWTNE